MREEKRNLCVSATTVLHVYGRPKSLTSSLPPQAHKTNREQKTWMPASLAARSSNLMLPHSLQRTSKRKVVAMEFFKGLDTVDIGRDFSSFLLSFVKNVYLNELWSRLIFLPGQRSFSQAIPGEDERVISAPFLLLFLFSFSLFFSLSQFRVQAVKFFAHPGAKCPTFNRNMFRNNGFNPFFRRQWKSRFYCEIEPGRRQCPR